MAWEMDRGMESWVEPSIWAYMEKYEDPHWEPIKLGGLSIVCPIIGFLCLRYADQRWDHETTAGYDALCRQAFDLSRYGQDLLVREIAASAIEYATTSNGAHEIYLHNGCHGVPWCSEDYMLTWFG